MYFKILMMIYQLYGRKDRLSFLCRKIMVDKMKVLFRKMFFCRKNSKMKNTSKKRIYNTDEVQCHIENDNNLQKEIKKMLEKIELY